MRKIKMAEKAILRNGRNHFKTASKSGCLKNILLFLVTAAVSASCGERTVEVDVAVIGGGASGVTAAVQAARGGAEVLLTEETPWLGGMLTSAGVSCIDGNYSLRSGIFGEFTDSLALRYGGYDRLRSGWVSNVCFEPKVGESVLENIVAGCGSGIRLMKETSLVSVVRKGDFWEGVLLTGGGRTVFRSRILIDATELGDVARMCGVKCRVGMDSRSLTGEHMAPEEANDMVQDLTYVVILKDYGPDADMTVPEPEGYDSSAFANCCLNPLNVPGRHTRTLWPPENMLTYGALPDGRHYMLNWPIDGNDCYVNTIDMDTARRDSAIACAKRFSLGFVRFIQTELGFRNMGIADDEYPTADGLPFIPYYRESRRICGKAFLTLDAVASPYEYRHPYYRTGVAVGDYPVDHHHSRNPDYENLPDLHFSPVPSFNVPAGVLVPEDVPGLLVAEKSVSVSNLVNGTTRLQPVVMQLGQAAGAWAALCVERGCGIDGVPIRALQNVLLESGCYIMPYLDLPRNDKFFRAVQRIGATGILRGEGKNVGWSNQTWFRTGDPLLYEELHLEGFVPDSVAVKASGLRGPVTQRGLSELLRPLAGGAALHAAAGKPLRHPIAEGLPQSCGDGEEGSSAAAGGYPEQFWEASGAGPYRPDETLTRLQAAAFMDCLFNPFGADVDYDGNPVSGAVERLNVSKSE